MGRFSIRFMAYYCFYFNATQSTAAFPPSLSAAVGRMGCALSQFSTTQARTPTTNNQDYVEKLCMSHLQSHPLKKQNKQTKQLKPHHEEQVRRAQLKRRKLKKVKYR